VFSAKDVNYMPNDARVPTPAPRQQIDLTACFAERLSERAIGQADSVTGKASLSMKANCHLYQLPLCSADTQAINNV
jgi:hypothetical protein